MEKRAFKETGQLLSQETRKSGRIEGGREIEKGKRKVKTRVGIGNIQVGDHLKKIGNTKEIGGRCVTFSLLSCLACHYWFHFFFSSGKIKVA